ncbi:MAG: metalloprotease [Thermoplasmata archaeon]|nr:metalloprotease [Thermoplasmata archaeon]
MSGWTPNPSYWQGTMPRERHHISTSPTELLHLSIAYVVLVIDLLLIEGFVRFNQAPGSLNTATLVSGLGFATTAAFTGFIAHEMAHKISAQRYGFWAEFRMSPVGLVVSLATAFAGFLFAAPGATVVGGMGDVREWGRTSLAGPLLNLAEGAVFFAAAVGSWTLVHSNPLWSVLLLLAFINGWFAAFNLIPVGPLDGRKVLRWSRPVWATSFVICLAFAVSAFVLVTYGTPPL